MTTCIFMNAMYTVINPFAACRWPASSIYASFEGASSVFINITALPQNGSISYALNW